MGFDRDFTTSRTGSVLRTEVVGRDDCEGFLDSVNSETRGRGKSQREKTREREREKVRGKCEKSDFTPNLL